MPGNPNFTKIVGHKKHNFDIANMQNSWQDDLTQFEFAFREKRHKQYIDNWNQELGSFLKIGIYHEINGNCRV